MTTASIKPTDGDGFETVLRFATKGLRDAKEHRKAGLLEQDQYEFVRGTHLAVALKALAGIHGVTLAAPLTVNGNDEFCITAMPADGSPLINRAGQFGTFAELLNRHSPNNGLSHCTLTPANGVCFMSDIGVEALVLEEAKARGI